MMHLCSNEHPKITRIYGYIPVFHSFYVFIVDVRHYALNTCFDWNPTYLSDHIPRVSVSLGFVAEYAPEKCTNT